MALLNGRNVMLAMVKEKPTEEKTVTPTTEAQEITADNGRELSKVTVEAVTSAIDANITPENILEGVSILGIEGTEKGYDEGVQSEYDRFWDAYQNNGAEVVDGRAFVGNGWNDKTFYPKYDIVCAANRADFLFQLSRMTNIKARLEECGVRLDTSKATNLYQAFMYSSTAELPEINASKSTSNYQTFASCTKLTKIDKLILSSDGTAPEMTTTFASSSALVDIVIEGVIAKNITMSNCSKLSVDSTKSVIEHLANYAGTENEGVYTLKLHANTWTALEASGTAPNNKTWKEYVTDLGWLY